jgi:hypothetical protein
VILPTKKLSPENSLLYVGGELLRLLDDPITVSRLWEQFQRARARMLEIDSCDVSFDWFVLALDLLYLTGAVSLMSGRLVKST